MNPNEFPAFSKPGLLSMYPQARSIKSMSKKNRSRNKTQDDLIAATVKITAKAEELEWLSQVTEILNIELMFYRDQYQNDLV
jgi:hypothetical protein